ncbi:ATP-binding protein [Streptomyces sp. NPDC006173]|uniref:ATP-binding protein n=1 Tax=Streptomyces sp. NPDC006173 TaxID=3155349 RepID=UPI0033FBD5C9
MARRTFTVVDIIEIYVHWYAGRSKSQVGASLGVDRKTVRKYLAPAEAAGIAPGDPPMGEADWAKLIKTWFPGRAERGLNQITWPEIDQHRDYVKSLLETTTVTTIHQRLGDEGKLKASISSFRRWVHENLPDEADVRQGANVRFAKTSRIVAELAGGHADRTWDKRMHELIRRDVLILDDFAMRQMTAAQADDLYELVSERQGRSLIITSNRAPSDWYPLFPNPVVAESLLDRLINTSHQVIMNGPSSRPNKRPRNPTDKNGTATAKDS